MPKSTGRAAINFSPKTLEIKGKSYFFRVGKLDGKLYVVAAMKKHVSGSSGAGVLLLTNQRT